MMETKYIEFNSKIFNQINEKEKALLIKQIEMIEKLLEKAKDMDCLKSIDMEKFAVELMHRYFPIYQGIGNQYNTFNSIIQNKN
jgi:uncharacterized Fe-S radical SAM superfamily protein PflX